MRILEAAELEFLRPVITAVENYTGWSTCQKSQRAAAVFKAQTVLEFGNNTPILRECIPALCQTSCGLVCTHAERVALQRAVLYHPSELTGSSLIHLKRKNGLIVPSDDLSCEDCSGFALRVQRVLGSDLGEFILQQSLGYVAYSMEEWHELTLKNLGLN